MVWVLMAAFFIPLMYILNSKGSEKKARARELDLVRRRLAEKEAEQFESVLSSLDDRELNIIGKTSRSAISLLSEEYHSRIGLEINVAEQILASWPNVADVIPISDVFLLAHNSMNDLLYGLGLENDKITAEIGCTRDELIEIFEKWKTITGRSGIQ